MGNCLLYARQTRNNDLLTINQTNTIMRFLAALPAVATFIICCLFIWALFLAPLGEIIHESLWGETNSAYTYRGGCDLEGIFVSEYDVYLLDTIVSNHYKYDEMRYYERYEALRYSTSWSVPKNKKNIHDHHNIFNDEGKIIGVAHNLTINDQLESSLDYHLRYYNSGLFKFRWKKRK